MRLQFLQQQAPDSATSRRLVEKDALDLHGFPVVSLETSAADRPTVEVCNEPGPTGRCGSDGSAL
jgi:hypothetical protein